MAFSVHDNIRETFTGAGSTTITKGGAAPGSRPLSAKYASGDTFWGVARILATGEISVGKFTDNGTTITQTEVKYSSNSDLAVSFSSGGAGEVYVDIPSYVLDHLNLVEEVLASAATTDLGSIKGLCIELQGTTNPSSFGTFKNKQRIVRYTGAGLTITTGSTLVCPGAVNLALATGDIFYAVSDNTATPIWRIMWVRRASGNVVVPGTLAATGAVSSSASVTAGTFVNAAAASGYQLGGVTTLTASGTYTFIKDPSAVTRLFFGNAGDQENYYDNDAHVFRTAAASFVFRVDATGIRPIADNVLKCGDSSFRWTTIYAVTGTINTSDADEKVLGKAPEAAIFEAILAVPMGLFQWKDSVEAKGKDGARLHYGPTAQAVRDELVKRKIDPTRYALFCVDKVFENEFYDDQIVHEFDEPFEEEETYEDGGEKKVRTVTKTRKVTKKETIKKVRQVDTGKQRLGLRLDQFDRLRTEAVRRLIQKT
jgi:hypothetical protein